MSSLGANWSRLETEGEQGEGYVRIRLPGPLPCAVYAARHVGTGLEAIVLELETEAVPGGVRYPRSVGFEVRGEPLTPGREGRTRVLLSLREDRFREVFFSLGEDVLASLRKTITPTEAIRALVGRLSRWQVFLKRFGPSGLLPERRRGLFGELWFLRSKVLPGLVSPAEAVAAWSGPRGANQDFQLEGGAVEVKTTAASTPHLVHVANVLQLDPAGLESLYVLLVLVNESDGASVSLPKLIDEIRGLLDDQAGPQFEDLLMESGYLERQRELYRAPRYHVRGTRFFEVLPGFPRIAGEDLPEGVAEVSFGIAIAACAEYEREDEVVMGRILGRGKRT